MPEVLEVFEVPEVLEVLEVFDLECIRGENRLFAGVDFRLAGGELLPADVVVANGRLP